MNEVWKSVIGYEGLYEVSSLGRVKNVITQHILCNSVRKGYLLVFLCVKGRKRTFSAHRLVAEAFIPNPNNLPFINHKDENPLNNCVDNLEWCDDKYNSNYGTRNQRIADANSIPVVQKTPDGNVIKEYPSAKQAQRETGIISNSISRCVGGKRKSAGGYIWELVSH